MYEIVGYIFLDVCEKVTSFCKVLITITQKKIGSFFCLTVYMLNNDTRSNNTIKKIK